MEKYITLYSFLSFREHLDHEKVMTAFINVNQERTLDIRILSWDGPYDPRKISISDEKAFQEWIDGYKGRLNKVG